jgi:hypothetical protein
MHDDWPIWMIGGIFVALLAGLLLASVLDFYLQ